jgi:hypothetical protein
MSVPDDRSQQKARVGLCLDCEHARRIASDRGATFYLCELAKVYPSFRKYPALPVLVCRGFTAKAKSSE